MLVLLRGGTARVTSGVVEAALPEIARKARLPFGAITFGHVVLGRSERVLGQLRAHERQHVRQYERWGVVFFLAYPVSSLTQVLRGRSPYWFNHFEVQAREHCAHEDRGPDEG